MRWLVADSLYCPEAFFCSHLDSYSHYLREYGEEVGRVCLTGTPAVDSRLGWYLPNEVLRGVSKDTDDVAFILDHYDWGAKVDARIRIAQVAAICNPMPWDVRKPDGSPAYDLVISSIPWMVDEARAKGCRAEYMPLAFDTRARVCGMGVERDLGCIFIGTTGPNHVRRTQLLKELKDVVTVLPPVFGREYFKTLARAKVVLNVHAEWARGTANNMRIFEAVGMGAVLVTDGEEPEELGDWFGWPFTDAREARQAVIEAIAQPDTDETASVLLRHTYENRIPRLVALARSL